MSSGRYQPVRNFVANNFPLQDINSPNHFLNKFGRFSGGRIPLPAEINAATAVYTQYTNATVPRTVQLLPK